MEFIPQKSISMNGRPPGSRFLITLHPTHPSDPKLSPQSPALDPTLPWGCRSLEKEQRGGKAGEAPQRKDGMIPLLLSVSWPNQKRIQDLSPGIGRWREAFNPLCLEPIDQGIIGMGNYSGGLGRRQTSSLPPLLQAGFSRLRGAPGTGGAKMCGLEARKSSVEPHSQLHSLQREL